MTEIPDFAGSSPESELPYPSRYKIKNHIRVLRTNIENIKKNILEITNFSVRSLELQLLTHQEKK